MPDRKLLEYVQVSARSRRNCDHKLHQSQHVRDDGKGLGKRSKEVKREFQTLKRLNEMKIYEGEMTQKEQLTDGKRKVGV
jgi:hypothetical protein